MHFRQIRNLIGKSVAAWVDDYAPSMGAALAYYTLFSLTPLLLIAIAVAGLVFGEEAARGEIVAQIEGLIGREGAIAVQGLLESANEPAHGVVALVLSLVTLIVGATTVFAELQSDLDRIWRVPAPATKRGLLTLLRTRLLSFGLVLGLGFLLLVSLVISAAIAALGKWWNGLFAGWEALLHALDFGLSLAITTFLFAMIYKFMPRARIPWRDVLPIRYVEPVYRPPSEAESLILPVTDGCSWNHCTFCEMYTAPQKHFRARDEAEVLESIRLTGERFGDEIRRVFLADGDALVLPTRRLLKILTPSALTCRRFAGYRATACRATCAASRSRNCANWPPPACRSPTSAPSRATTRCWNG
jgi:YihY family inner membrane protein